MRCTQKQGCLIYGHGWFNQYNLKNFTTWRHCRKLWVWFSICLFFFKILFHVPSFLFMWTMAMVVPLNFDLQLNWIALSFFLCFQPTRFVSFFFSHLVFSSLKFFVLILLLIFPWNSWSWSSCSFFLFFCEVLIPIIVQFFKLLIPL